MQGPRIGLSSKKGVSIPAIGILVLFVLARGILPGEPESVPSFPELEGWKLVFEDQFDGPKLDYEKWTPKDPWGVERNGELQGYSRQNFIQENGVLTIVAEKTPAFYDGKRREYRSGMMTTTRKFSQRYGRFAIRCRIPRGQGLWPAFWMLPEPPSWPPEIDVFEILGQEYLSHHTTHYGKVDSYGWLFTPGVIFHLNDRLGIKLGAEIDSHDTVWLAGARLHF